MASGVSKATSWLGSITTSGDQSCGGCVAAAAGTSGVSSARAGFRDAVETRLKTVSRSDARPNQA
ncbi:hypothetical protein D3C87_1960840 [compost metagenome]